MTSPRAFFQQSQTDNRDKLAEQCKQSPLRNAAIFALAEMAFRGCTQEQLQGAKMYAEILMSLGEPAEQNEPFPDKSLKTI